MDFELGGGSDRPVGLFGTLIYGPASLPWGDPEKTRDQMLVIFLTA